MQTLREDGADESGFVTFSYWGFWLPTPAWYYIVNEFERNARRVL